jgi:alkanesulfonate monooxygenase SsuD/methylene tetrahydromethanopterin reductase-like flavin-dependent oxidoreductase (luciferase family)
MQFYWFTEQPYPEAWDADSLRVNLPNRECDPVIAAEHYNRHLDEWMLADELGLNIMINEHHSTATCLASSATPFLSILARQTKNARLLVLGMPIANRPDPVRVAEEMSIVDVISRGRLELGFVKGVPYEVFSANLNPVRMMDRFWEAHDLILKALSTHDGPFSWEGEYYNYRSVNVWPRVYQTPHPPIWITAGSPGTARGVAERGHRLATVLGGYEKTRIVHDAYKHVRLEMGQPAPDDDAFGYIGLVAVASSEKEARRRANLLAEYPRTSAIAYPAFRNPPGYLTPEASAQMISQAEQGRRGKMLAKAYDGRTIDIKTATIDELRDIGVVSFGTPDQVAAQIARFSDAVGGIGHWIAMGHAGRLTHEDTVDSMTLFANEVAPQLADRATSPARVAPLAPVEFVGPTGFSAL